MIEHQILKLTEECTGCFACANVCPKDAITLPSNFEGFYFPVIDDNKCIECGLCDKICPQVRQPKLLTMQKAYYGYSVNNKIRKKSSSGGIFYELATDVINQGGVVYGASFNYDGLIRLECHSTEEVSLYDLMRAKYVQSYIGYAFRSIKEDLQIGKMVLFCGTPCQVAGLKSFLKIDYSNLLLVDFICHGVPSMDMLRKHIRYLGIDNVVEINFRPKNTSWVDDFEITFKKKSASPMYNIRRIPWMFDEYFRLFQSYENIRRSCRNCSYCNGQRASDITIADFWGYKDFNPSIYDKRGLSLIIANTNQGINVVEKLRSSNTCNIYELPTEYANYAYKRIRTEKNSPYQSPKRDTFIRDVYEKGYEKALINNNLQTSKIAMYKFRIKRYIKTVLHRNDK